MAVRIKLQRLGKIRAPYYRVIVADASTRRDGKAIETIGKYHPKDEPSLIEVDSDRAQYWLSVGAQPTEPVQRILKVTGDWQKFKGLPGAEGTLQVAEAKPTKEELFNKALAEIEGEPSSEAASTPKNKGGKKSDKGAEQAADTATDARGADRGADREAEQATDSQGDEDSAKQPASGDGA